MNHHTKLTQHASLLLFIFSCLPLPPAPGLLPLVEARLVSTVVTITLVFCISLFTTYVHEVIKIMLKFSVFKVIFVSHELKISSCHLKISYSG